MKPTLDKIKGCLLGGAIGDSFGAPVEFSSMQEIKDTYGAEGLTFSNFNGEALITDDTQMTLFTANGLLLDGDPIQNIWDCYQDWLDTQHRPDRNNMSHEPISWLVEDSRMFAMREPGATCMYELEQKHFGTLEHSYNNSKGCGGIMRIAPVGLVANSRAQAIEIGARSAALTHGHTVSSIASAYLACLIYILAHEDMSLATSIAETSIEIKNTISAQPALDEVMEKVELAQDLAKKSTASDIENIMSLGQGWVAEETLGIGIYSALKYEHDFKKAIEVSVNHDGDSDSTGNLVGQILGAKYGCSVLPKDYLAKLELVDVIKKMAEQLYAKVN